MKRIAFMIAAALIPPALAWVGGWDFDRGLNAFTVACLSIGFVYAIWMNQ